MLKKSLVTKYLDEFREIAGNEQIPIQFEKGPVKEKKYDPERVQTYFDKGQESEPLSL